MTLAIAPPVADALAAGQPVVALETTIVSHGMPWPQNLETALAVEDDIREAGATPATISVADGTVRVGLTPAELEALAQAKDVRKLSTADLAHALVTGAHGATTVAATMVAARLAGIGVFATGGIGGVHRGWEKTLDISADLTELGRTDVVVVAAGAKALLDIPATLEVLETNAVPVVCYRTDAFPAFWSRDSGETAPLRSDSPEDIARFADARRALGLSGGMLVANPVPETDEIRDMGPIIEAAVAEAEEKGIRGKAVTPFLLDSVYRRTEGRSLTTNIALVRNNARLAAKIAAAMAG